MIVNVLVRVIFLKPEKDSERIRSFIRLGRRGASVDRFSGDRNGREERVIERRVFGGACATADFIVFLGGPRW